MNHSFKIPVIVFLLISSTLCLTCCKKKDTIPALTTVSVSGITQTSAVSGGNVTSDGGAEVTARGVCWGTSHNPTTSLNKTNDGTGTGTYTSNITGLMANTTFYVRAYATNSEGTSYGNEVSFATTQIALATLTTTAVTSITPTTSVSGGTINDDGGGTIAAYGVCWSIAQNPTITDNKTIDGSGTGVFSSNITGLTTNTTYYIRAYATNDAGTAYGTQISFTTSGYGAIIFNTNLTYGTVSDIDGNVYKTIQIGTQTWMAENLKTTKYNNGTDIPLIPNAGAWTMQIYNDSSGYCWYNNDVAAYKVDFGALYNWYTVITGNLCPTGWHVPSIDEWTTLINYLGGDNVAGDKAKETGNSHWNAPYNVDATNESGFTALPSGSRDLYGHCLNIGERGYWWSSTAIPQDQFNDAWYVGMDCYGSGFSTINNSYYAVTSNGFPVRCVKN